MRYPSRVRPGGDVRAVLPVAFDDAVSGPDAITARDADAIARFVLYQASKGADGIAVHCDAGASRSAAAAIAIAEHLGIPRDGIAFAEAPDPNPAVYEAIAEALQERASAPAGRQGRAGPAGS